MSPVENESLRGNMSTTELTGVPVITSQNAIQLNHVVEAMIEASVAVSDD